MPPIDNILTEMKNLGFFEDVQMQPKQTEDPAQLDLDVSVVERPTGSFSFGASYSSQDGLVFTAALSQANLFGRGYGVNLSVDVGGRTDRYYVSLSDPYFLGSSFSLGGTFFLTRVNFDTFNQLQQGIDINLGHALREDNTARGFLRYSYARRRVERDTSRTSAAAVIFREILQGNESSSMLGVSFRSDTRNDRFAPTAGTSYGANIDYSGLGGFANFLRLEGRFSWYLGAPSWMFDRSSFVVAARVGYTVPFNELEDYRFVGLQGETPCDDGACLNAAPLTEIDTDIKLPLTERYFLGGIGNFQLRGFKARSVGPRRAILRRTGLTGEGSIFHPVGTEFDPTTGVAQCLDIPRGSVPGGRPFQDTQGNKNGRCNDINDRNIKDFDDLRETDVIGGNKFATVSLEYRFPISETVGLQAVLFFDAGNAFAEGQSLFDFADWRYAWGGGVLWFSPFGPLQVVLGFPIDPLPVEKSPVFEFSVGGFGY